MKAIERWSHVVLFIMLYKVVLTFKSVDPSVSPFKRSYWAVLSCGTVYYAVQGGSNLYGKSVDKTKVCYICFGIIAFVLLHCLHLISFFLMRWKCDVLWEKAITWISFLYAINTGEQTSLIKNGNYLGWVESNLFLVIPVIGKIQQQRRSFSL